MSPTPDTLRTFGARFAMTGEVTATPLYDEHDARDTERGIEVGLWVPKPALFASADARQRLARAVVEVRAVVDPRLRRVFAAGDAPAPWVSLQPARGLAVGPAMPRAEIAAWIDAVAGALIALHDAGLVHGGSLEHDVVVVDGEIRLGGGALWACADPIALATATTAALIAPERRRGEPASAASDAWAFAALVARWIGGPGPDPLLAVHRDHPPLAAVLGPTLADAPAQRSLDLAGLAGAVRDALASPVTPLAPTPHRRRRKKQTTEEKTEVGHASGIHGGDGRAAEPDRDDEPTDRAQPPAPPGAAVPRDVADVRSAPILAVSMKPGGPGQRLYEQPTPPAPTPQLPRPNLRASTRDDPSRPLGRLAPPRAVVERARARSRRAWLVAVLGVVVVAGIVLAVLVTR